MESIEPGWPQVEEALKKRFGKVADVKATLFIIGLREYGKKKKKFTKEEKQDMMNLAACKIMSLAGYFRVKHLDGDGWPVWEQIKPMPEMNVKEQEDFIKEHIIRYFEEEKLF